MLFLISLNKNNDANVETY